MLLRKLYNTLRSLQLTIVLLIALGALFLAGLLVPQQGLLGYENYISWKEGHPTLVQILELLQLTRIYTSYAMITLWSLFFLNLTCVFAHRLPIILRKCGMPELPDSPEALQGTAQRAVLDDSSIEALGSTLRATGYLVSSDGKSLAAVKNRLSPLGTILFHASFILLLAGALEAYYTKFRAEADVATGETFSGNYTSIIQQPKFGGIPGTVFTVLDVKPRYYERNITVDLNVRIESRKRVSDHAINKPFKDGSLSFVINSIDIAPFFVVRDSRGAEIDNAVIKLKVLDGKEDSFGLAGYVFRVKFFTDIASVGSARRDTGANLPQVMKQRPSTEEVKQDREITNPGFRIEAYRDGVLIASGLIKPGEPLSLGGYTIAFTDLSYWVHFYVGSEKGLWVIYGSFLLASVALALRLWFYRREIRAYLDDGRLHVAGRGEYYPVLFADEFENIITAAINTTERGSS